MKCPKCGLEVKPNYRFCTKCGQPMTEETPAPSKTQEEKRIETGTPKSFVAPSAEDEALKARRHREENQVEELPALTANVANSIDLVRGKAFWNMGKGQLARRITESEFAQLDKVQGVVIQEGVTAVVTVDGQFMGMLSGGYYEFATEAVKEKAKANADREEQEEKEDENFLQKAGNTARRVWRFLTGTLDKEKAEARKKRKERVRRNIQRITANSAVNVTLVSTRNFDLLFGSTTNAQGITDFVPMTIKAKVVDLEMGVSLQMQITNVNDFLVNYLSDKNSFSIVDAQRLVQPAIENLLNRMLRNLDYQAEGLPEELVAVIKNQIQKTVNERVFGLEVIQVLDITDQSADFERFRSVEHELFASEQELGYLQRTGEFRNRLAEETNHQTIQEAKSEEDLRYALSQINRDGLLHDDEMEAFLQLLNSQKRLREAKTDEQEYEALQDLRKCRLVKEEDVAVLEDLLARKELERGEVTELLRLRVFQSTEEARLKAENALSNLELQQQLNQDQIIQEHQHSSEISSAQHKVEMTDFEIQARRKQDEYSREQGSLDYDMEHRQKVDEMTLEQQRAEFEHQQRRAEKFEDVDVLERKAAIARANMEKMQEHERQLEEMKRQTEELRIKTEAGMTQEQIAAAHMKDMAGLDAAAQAEMAKMMGSGKEKEAEMLREQQERERQLYEQMMQMMQQNQQGQQQSAQMTQEQMLKMMQTMMSGMAQMGGQRISEVERMKEEYRDQAVHQQERTDRTQDSALNYTTRVTESSQENNPTITVNTNVKPVFCPNCGGKATTDDKVCPHCGEPLEE